LSTFDNPTMRIELTPRVCGACGVRYGIDKDYFERSLCEHKGGAERPEGDSEDTPEDGWYYCPNGHPSHTVRTGTEVAQERCVELSRKLEMAEAKAAEFEQKFAYAMKVIDQTPDKPTRRGRKSKADAK